MEINFLARIGARLPSFLKFAPPSPPSPENAIAVALRAAGIPGLAEPADQQDALALATSLLDVAAELEHALMIEYLYAAYSVRETGASQAIARVAAQEMGHLATVQNLRLALGLPTYMGRQDLDPQPAKDPFVFRREPISLDSLAKYAAAEIPAADQIPPSAKADLDEIIARAEVSAGGAVHRVGAIYATLYWLFLSTDPGGSRPWPNFPERLFHDQKVPQLSGLQPANLTRQAEPGEWRASSRGLHVNPCDSGAAALQAIFHIAAQGEGLAADPDSHFLRFVELYRRMRNEGLEVNDVPVDPHTGAGPAESLITDPTALAISNLLDAAYGALQLEILISFELDRGGPMASARRALIRHALSDVMLGSIAPLAGHLAATLPRTAGQATSDLRRPGPIFSPFAVTGGSLAELIAAWRETIDLIETRVGEALAQPDPTGLLAGDLGTVGETVESKRQLLARIGAP